MIGRLRCLTGSSFDPYRNLAIERYLTETAAPGELTLYLWQNRRTVVLGRNQNAWQECRVTRLLRDGGSLTRRLSGGGAVYHDLGNLNFTFAVQTADYDQERQLQVIVGACRALGIPAVRSGRNDILADGYKFSGNSFYSHAGRSFHNGTLLVDADLEALSRYLSPSKLKLESKGVASVRARVTNLTRFRPDLTVPMVCAALIQAFSQVYGLPVDELREEELDEGAILARREDFRGEEWLYGKKLPFSCSFSGRFDWGEVTFQLAVTGGICTGAAVWTDALDSTFAPTLAGGLRGCRFSAADLCGRIRGEPACAAVAADLCALVAAQDL